MIQRDKAIRYLNQLVLRGNTPGFQYAVVNDQATLFSHCAGYGDISLSRAMTPSTTFNGFSITKTMTALAILQLVQSGRVGLNDSVANYLPEVPYIEEISIKQLLTHTSGIANPMPLKWIHLKDDAEDFDSNQFFREVLKQHSKLKGGPGERFAYSNLGYVLLGQVVESVTQIPFVDYVRTHILDRIPVSREQLDFVIHAEENHAKGYQKTRSTMNLLLGFFIKRRLYMTGREGVWSGFKSIYVNGPAYGGLIGNAAAFASYLQQLLAHNSTLLADEYKSLMFTQQTLTNGEGIPVGLGWFHGTLHEREYFTHSGGGGGYYSELRIYPQHNLATVIMLNRSGMKDERLLGEIDNYVLFE